ncbi:MAG: hypothetical protein ACE149_11720 [Armatimonadota bacterium]
MRTITVDFAQGLGAVKPLQGLCNGPVGYGTMVDVAHYYRKLTVPYVRLHDPNWPHPREVDIPQIFPDFGADPDDPRSYDFRRTDSYLQAILDTGARIVYRLGVSIEHTKTKYYTDPPADFEKWARICGGVVRHYTQGWADGMRDAVSHWEIWNEPDIGDGRMWSGTWDQYMALYETAARYLKTMDPGLRVGGYAAANVASDNLPRFLRHCQARKVPLDFFSWHTYAGSPDQVAKNARTVRKLLDEHGFAGAESHLNEWNYWAFDWETIFLPGYEFIRKEAFDLQKSEVGASFAAAVLIGLQDERVDVANYYDGQPFALFCGLFDYHGVPQKTYHAFEAFRRMLDYPQRVQCARPDEDPNLYCLAAMDAAKGRAAVLVSSFGGRDGECVIRLKSAPFGAGAKCRVFMLDRDRNLEVASAQTVWSDGAEIKLLLRRHCVALVQVAERSRR